MNAAQITLFVQHFRFYKHKELQKRKFFEPF